MAPRAREVRGRFINIWTVCPFVFETRRELSPELAAGGDEIPKLFSHEIKTLFDFETPGEREREERVKGEGGGGNIKSFSLRWQTGEKERKKDGHKFCPREKERRREVKQQHTTHEFQ